MKTKTTIFILSFFSFFLIGNIAKADDTCEPSGRTCIEVTDPENIPSCPSGKQKTTAYKCENKGYGLFGAICCEDKSSSSGSVDCTQEGPCQGKNANDSCTTSSGTSGVCGKVGSSGGCFCWSAGSGTGTGAYEAAPENYNPGACPDPSKEYRDASGNCVPYGSGYEAAPEGYNPDASNMSGSNNPNLDCSGGVCFPSSTSLPDPSGGVVGIITNVLYWLLSIFGILAVIAFVISGIQYILSTGSEEMIDKAKSSMKWSIVGVAVALSGLIVIYAIDKMLRGTSNF